MDTKKSKKIKNLAKGYAKNIKRNKYITNDSTGQIDEENENDEATNDNENDDEELSDDDKQLLLNLEQKLNNHDEDQVELEKPSVQFDQDPVIGAGNRKTIIAADMNLPTHEDTHPTQSLELVTQ